MFRAACGQPARSFGNLSLPTKYRAHHTKEERYTDLNGGS